MAEKKQSGSELFQKCLAASFALHVGLLIGGRLYHRMTPPLPVEVDLSMFDYGRLGTGPAKLAAQKRLTPGAKGLPKPVEEPVPVTPPPPETPKPKEWVSGDQTKKTEKLPDPAPTPDGSPTSNGTAVKPGGSGEGSNTGVPGGRGDGGAPLKKWPVLLNRDELMSMLRRYYPEVERRAGREGAVRVRLHIGVDGKVDPVEIWVSGGASFDVAAREVGRRMRFSPAIGLDGNPVPVALPQDIIFRLED